MIITIDGPAGSGKSTAARNLAKALGVAFLDTGATYRAVTLKALNENANMQDEQSLVKIAREMDLRMTTEDHTLRVLLDGNDVTEQIRTERVSQNAKYAANAPNVRNVLVALQRRIGDSLGDFVTEGRDQGTVVFPHADVKFYLDAKPEQRAERRCDELKQRGENPDYDQVLEAIRKRDQSDRSRKVGPLTIPDDAEIIDTSDKDIEQTLQTLVQKVKSRR